MNLLSIQPRLKKAAVQGFLVFGLYFLLSLSFAQVTNLDDAGAGSLRDVITAAGEGDTITFQAGLSGTINLTSVEIVIDENNLTINGAGTSITLDGQSANRIFNHTSNGTLTVNNLTFQNGNDGGNSGGAIRSAGNLVIRDSTFRNNTSTGDGFAPSFLGGGALYVQTGITVDNSTFINNIAFRGGAVISRSGPVTITNSTMSNNTANRWGGCHLWSWRIRHC
ncbi:MAG: hypothetical protein AAF267_00820 [Deinococcota bacterium]